MPVERWSTAQVEALAPDAGSLRGARAKPTPDPVAAAKRARERAERVAGGMAELGRWLDDQIEHGLAGAARGGHQPFEAMSRRLTDAQAPGAAKTVGRLGSVAGVGPHWADRLLGELALLRLLVAGHDRLDALDPALAATVRARIGFPVAADDVLAGPRVDDRWQVLGQVESDDGPLTTRRSWLRGAATGRFALVLAFAAPGQSLPVDLVPGTEFRGGLCFYPGAAPLRALVATRDSGAEPFERPDGGGPARAALAGWTALLAAEPWRSEVPVLLDAVTPSEDGFLVDASGGALPLAAGHRPPWWLLAAAGGVPATVAAEWSPAGLRPLAAWVAGRFVPATPSSPVAWREPEMPGHGGRRAPEPAGDGPARGPELPGDLLAAALVGTARRPWSDAATATAGSTAAPGTGATALLEAAAVALLRRRAGVLPETGRAPVGPAPAETAPPVSGAAADRLARILGGAVPGGSHLEQELLSQWLAAAAASGRIVPPAMLPDLLAAGRRNTMLRPDLARVAGRRGGWLAARRPDWRWLLDETSPALLPDWQTGTVAERLGHLAELRRTDPDRARELLAEAWPGESPEHRARFLGTLAAGLGPADEPLLERALDDRRKEVREIALGLLRRLPGAALGARLAARAHAVVRLERGRLVVEPLGGLDDDLRRDGVSATPLHGRDIGAWLLEEVLAGTPLDTWTGLEPAGFAALARGHDWADPLLHGWAKAAVWQHDARWAAALLRAGAPLRESVRWDLHLVLPPAELGRLAADALRRDDSAAHRLLALHPGPWPRELSVAVLQTVAQRARTDRHSWQLGELCRTAAVAMPPAAAPAVERLAAELAQSVDPSRVRPVAELAQVLIFRDEMARELDGKRGHEP